MDQGTEILLSTQGPRDMQSHDEELGPSEKPIVEKGRFALHEDNDNNILNVVDRNQLNVFETGQTEPRLMPSLDHSHDKSAEPMISLEDAGKIEMKESNAPAAWKMESQDKGPLRVEETNLAQML